MFQSHLQLLVAMSIDPVRALYVELVLSALQHQIVMQEI